MPGLRDFLLTQHAKSGQWRKLFFAVLGGLLALNIVFQPHEPHFGLDDYPFFWAVFGLGIGLAMVYVMKKIIQPRIVRKEDYYGDI